MRRAVLTLTILLALVDETKAREARHSGLFAEECT